MSLEPAVAATIGFLALGQDLSALELVAIALVVSPAPAPCAPRRRRPRAEVVALAGAGMPDPLAFRAMRPPARPHRRPRGARARARRLRWRATSRPTRPRRDRARRRRARAAARRSRRSTCQLSGQHDDREFTAADYETNPPAGGDHNPTPLRGRDLLHRAAAARRGGAPARARRRDRLDQRPLAGRPEGGRGGVQRASSRTATTSSRRSRTPTSTSRSRSAPGARCRSASRSTPR